MNLGADHHLDSEQLGLNLNHLWALDCDHIGNMEALGVPKEPVPI